MRWRTVLAMLVLGLTLTACGGGGGGASGGGPAFALSFDVDLAGTLRALPRPTMGALEAT